MSWASLSLKNLTNALHEVDDWQGLGIRLEIDYHELKKLAKLHSTVEERKYEMLQLWLDSDTKASWTKLLTALSEMKLNRVAEEIKRKYQMPPSTQSEDAPLLVTAEPENVHTADPSSAPPTDQTLTTQCENVTAIDPDSSLAPPTEQTEETSTEGVRKVQLEIAALEAMYDDLVGKAGVFFSKRQALSSDFFVEFRISVAVLPTSLKYQHDYFLKHHSSEIARATTVEEIFSILNRYWNFLNCSLLAHTISKFGDEELQKQLSTYTTALQAFRSRTKITDFVKTCPGNQKIPPEFVALKTKLSPDWKDRTLEDAEVYRMSMVHSSSLACYALYLTEGVPGSIYLLWSVPSHAIDFLAAAMNSEFLQHHCIEEVTIDGEDLKEYKRQHYIFDSSIQYFKVINQHVDELSEGLVWASREGCLEDVVFLLSTGVEVNSRGQWRGMTALMWASKGGCLDVVKELLRAQAAVDMQDESGETALMLASGSGDTDVVQLLLSSGAQVDLQDKDGETALMWASGSGHTDVVQLLLSSGAQVDLQDEDGLTALIHAVKPQIYFLKHDETGTVKALLAAGADVNHQEKTAGRSAVFYGAEEGDLEVVKLLIQGGANLSIKDKDGVTADQVAEVQGHHAVCEELRKHMHGGRRPLSKTVRDRVLATGQLLRALYKRLEERILRTQKKELARRTQGLDPEIILPSTPSRKGVRDPRGPRHQEENIPGHVH